LGNTNDNNKLSKSDAVNDGTISNKKVEKTITVTGVYPVYVNIDSGSFVNETKEMPLTNSSEIELDVPSEVESGIHFTFDYPNTHSVTSFKIWSKLEGDFVDYSASYENVSETVEKNINGVEYTYNRLVTKENLQGEGKYKIILSKRLDE
jgi:hypothetical protein